MSKKKNPFRDGVCVAPVGRTLPHAKKRLMSLPKEMRETDPEHIMMKLWAKENVRNKCRNFGLTPIDSILHRCNEQCEKRLSLSGLPSHEYLPPNEDEVKIICATVQWFARNGGRDILRQFFKKLDKLYNLSNSTKPKSS
jgi:hypothetical protein